MPEDLVELIDDLRKMQTLLDFMIKGIAALATQSIDEKLRLTDVEAHQVTECGRDMVDRMIKRVEEAFKEQFSKPPIKKP